MIVFTRFPYRHLLRLNPETVYVDIPREFPAEVISFRPPYVLERKADPLRMAMKLAEYLSDELVISSRSIKSGRLYAEGLVIEYEYDGHYIRKKNVSYAKEPNEPYSIEGNRKILRPVSLLLLDYDAIMINRSHSIGYSTTRKLSHPLPGVWYKKGDPISLTALKAGSYNDHYEHE